MSVAILCGNHWVSAEFTEYMLSRYARFLGFVEFDGVNDRLTSECINAQVPFSQYETEETTIEKIKAHGVTTVVLAWWPKIVHKINKLGINVINTHPSYLPYNRGKYPSYWALVEGTPFGATIHMVDDGVDTGSILWQKKIQLGPTDTGESAYEKAAEAMYRLLFSVAYDIARENFPVALAQDNKISTSHHSRDLEIPPITNPTERAFINDLRARTYYNRRSGRKIEIDGKMYRVHLNLVEDEGS